jgi:hypothetical protein
MSFENEVKGINIGSFGTFISIILVFLKLFNIITISWFWAIFPLWISWAIIIFVHIIFLIVGIIICIIHNIFYG